MVLKSDPIKLLGIHSDEIQTLCAIVVMLLTLIMAVYAHKALNTYRSQILYEIEIESKALALRTFEIYLKLNVDEFHEHLLKGDFLKQYEERYKFYENEFIEQNNEALIRRYIFEQTDFEIEEEMKQMRIVTYKVLSTFQNKAKYKRIYEYYSKFFTFYQYYKQHCRNLTALIFEHYNEPDADRKKILMQNIETLSHYFSAEKCRQRNDELQFSMERATGIE